MTGQGSLLGRNLRSVWRFELPRRCILAGTPEKACATCGAPWERLTEREVDNTGYPKGPGGNAATVGWRPTCECHGKAETAITECADCGGSGGDGDDPCPACGGAGTRTTRVWPAGVLDEWPTRPAVVLDPFAGSGTTLMVAEELGRWWIGIELAEEYVPLMRERTGQASLARALDPCRGG